MYSSSSANTFNWDKATTLKFIKRRIKEDVNFNGKPNSATIGYMTIVQDLGIPITEKQARSKWQNLNYKYKELKRYLDGSDEGYEKANNSWPFFDILDKFFTKKQILSFHNNAEDNDEFIKTNFLSQNNANNTANNFQEFTAVNTDWIKNEIIDENEEKFRSSLDNFNDNLSAYQHHHSQIQNISLSENSNRIHQNKFQNDEGQPFIKTCKYEESTIQHNSKEDVRRRALKRKQHLDSLYIPVEAQQQGSGTGNPPPLFFPSANNQLPPILSADPIVETASHNSLNTNHNNSISNSSANNLVSSNQQNNNSSSINNCSISNNNNNVNSNNHNNNSLLYGSDDNFDDMMLQSNFNDTTILKEISEIKEVVLKNNEYIQNLNDRTKSIENKLDRFLTTLNAYMERDQTKIKIEENSNSSISLPEDFKKFSD